MSLANDSKQQTACRGHEEPCEGPEPPQALIGQQEQAAAYSHLKVSLQTTKVASELPASKGCQRALLQGSLCLNYIAT